MFTNLVRVLFTAMLCSTHSFVLRSESAIASLPFVVRKHGPSRLAASADGDDDDDSWGTAEKVPQAVQPEKERDLFIPIFTLVAITGFAGAYGYEMLRLYQNGELYLPF